MGKRQIVAMQEALYEALNFEIEKRMVVIFEKHRSLGCLLKCMGCLTAYDMRGEPVEPAFMRSLQELADMDVEYYSLTGHPLKLTRNPDGTTRSVRDW